MLGNHKDLIKCQNGCGMPELAINKFCGFPIGDKLLPIVTLNAKAKNKKSIDIDVESEVPVYQEENGFVVVTLKQLEKDFTL